MVKLTNRLAGILLIGFGCYLLAVVIIAVLGYQSFMKLGIIMGMHLIPKGQDFEAGLEFPISMTATASVLKARGWAEKGLIAAGEMTFKATMDIVQLENTVPAMYLEEANGLGETQRVVMKPGPLNYGSIFSWFMAFFSLELMVVGAWLRFSSNDDDDVDVNEVSDAGSNAGSFRDKD